MPRSKTEKKLSLLLGGLSLALTGLLSFLSPSHSRQRESEEEKSKAAKYELREADAKGLMHVGMSLFFGAILMHLGLTFAFFQLRRHSGESPQTLSNLKGHPTFTQDFQSYLKNVER
jgi:hypothetical protein